MATLLEGVGVGWGKALVAGPLRIFCGFPNTVTMIPIIDGNAGICAHVRSDHGYLICLDNCKVKFKNYTSLKRKKYLF